MNTDQRSGRVAVVAAAGRVEVRVMVVEPAPRTRPAT
jgi:hypothetical protein